MQRGSISFHSHHHSMMINYIHTSCYRPLFVQSLLEIQSEQTVRNACDIILKDSMNASIYTIIIFDLSAHTPFDCYAVGYCVAASGHEWSIKTSGIGGNEVVEMLGCGLQSTKQCSGSIYKLALSSNSLSHEAMNSLSKFPSNVLSGLHTLDLSHNRLNKTALN